MPTDRPKGFVELHLDDEQYIVRASCIETVDSDAVDGKTCYDRVGVDARAFCDETSAELAALIAEAQAEDPAVRIADALEMLCNYASLAVSESSSSSDGMHQTTPGLRMSTSY